MESSVSNIIGRLGAGSGIDMVQLANDLADTRYAVQRDRLNARNEALNAQISAASLLRGQLLDLASALGSRIRTGDLAPRPQISNPSVAEVSVQQGASPRGNYSLEVSQLAREQVLASKNFTNSTDTVGAGSLRITFGTVNGTGFTADSARTPLDITVDASDTLDTLAGKINAAGGGDLTAYVANGTNGAQLLIKGQEGAINGFTLDGMSSAANPSATPGDLSYLSWNPASDAGELRQGSLDALFSLDTVAMQSATNAISGLPEGMTLDLLGTNVGAPASIGFASNTGQISAVMGDFVSALNEVASQLAQSAAPLGGELGHDSGARALKRALSSLSGTVVMPNAGAGEPSTLADLGLSINRDGTFRLDSDRLTRNLTDFPDAVGAMFTVGLHGVFATIDSVARANTASGDPGTLGGSIERYNAQIARNDERLAKIADQQEMLRARLTKSLVAADRRVTLSQSTLSFVKSQIAIWNQPNN